MECPRSVFVTPMMVPSASSTATHSFPIRSSQAMQDKKATRTSAMCHFGRTSLFDMQKMTIPAAQATASGT